MVRNYLALTGFNGNERARKDMPKTKTYRGWFVGVLLAALLLMLQSPLTSRAQDDQNDNDQDPPTGTFWARKSVCRHSDIHSQPREAPAGTRERR